MSRPFRFSLALSLVGVLGYYDVAVGDYVGDRLLLAVLLLQPLLAFTAHRRPGVSRFPVLFCLSIAATVLGFLLLIEPALGEKSAALAIMPLWGLLLWAFAFLFGGAAAVYGLLEARNDYEAAGCTLQGVAYLTAAIATIFSSAIPPSPLGIMFLTALAAGFIWRSYAIRS